MSLIWGCCVWDLNPPIWPYPWHTPLPSYFSFLVFIHLLSRAHSSFCRSDLISSPRTDLLLCVTPGPHSAAWYSRPVTTALESHLPGLPHATLCSGQTTSFSSPQMHLVPFPWYQFPTSYTALRVQLQCFLLTQWPPTGLRKGNRRPPELRWVGYMKLHSTRQNYWGFRVENHKGEDVLPLPFRLACSLWFTDITPLVQTQVIYLLFQLNKVAFKKHLMSCSYQFQKLV